MHVEAMRSGTHFPASDHRLRLVVGGSGLSLLMLVLSIGVLLTGHWQ